MGRKIDLSIGVKVAIGILILLPWFVAGIFYGAYKDCLRIAGDLGREIEIMQAELSVYEKTAGRPQIIEFVQDTGYGRPKKTILKLQYEYNVCTVCHKEVSA